MILSATFSVPTKQCNANMGRDYTKIKFTKNGEKFDGEFFTQKQVFHSTYTTEQLEDFIQKQMGASFKNGFVKTDTQEITYLSNKRGEVKKLVKKSAGSSDSTLKKNTEQKISISGKNYLIPEGQKCEFLEELGVMNKDGKVLAQKYDKFRQINRFLEFIKDVISEIELPQDRPLQIIDFGSGKSYLTFAIYYYLTSLCKINCRIIGLDLKKDVIEHCNQLAQKLNYTSLNFYVGDIADYQDQNPLDIVVTLHACDTATDFALNYAIRKNAKAILSVPCCQHQINLQLKKKDVKEDSPISSLTRYGLIRERMAALATDAVRAEILEQMGYNVQILEFIDDAHTPKNILIRGIKKKLNNENALNGFEKSRRNSINRKNKILQELGVVQQLDTLLADF